MSRLNLKLLTLLLVTFATIISADLFTVHVGANGNNVFDPQTTTGLKIGDVVQFVWDSGFHSVTPSDGPDDSCTPSKNIPEIQSSTKKPAGNVTFEIKEDTPSTVFYFCTVHCSGGMHGSLELA
ncbi:extracellular serine-rich protein [Gigaspora margarita]|uniref:Extracellular serine-rich protein n=1 Tax=Gigaspora margarita TaxID=4874 RepID=A0A8H3XBR7_GIGMA|nr:extracellular serine-rich protein [Gigaspora margarita]